MTLSHKHLIAVALANAYLAGPPSLILLEQRCAHTLGKGSPWLRKLTQNIHAMFGASLVTINRRDLVQVIAADANYLAAWRPGKKPPRIHHAFLQSPSMRAPRAFVRERLPALPTTSDLAQWLDMTLAQLDWFTCQWDAARRTNDGPLQHYQYRWLRKRSGAHRLLEIPKSRLREAQRKILHMILDRVPPHESAHGFRRGHSCATYAAAHIGQKVVMRLDLQNFFPGIPAPRVHGLFHSLGYPEAVARSLTALVTHRTPDKVLTQWPVAEGMTRADWRERRQYALPHLPQGAPTSPALANLCAFKLDVRLAAAARAVGARYTRYADDLAFSGSETFRRNAARFHIMVCRIVLEEGFAANTRKTRVMPQGVRQQLTGIVVNARPNIVRDKYERLKATLHNCATLGTAAQNIDGLQNFRAHLLGQIAYVNMLNAERAFKLRKIFDRIAWD